MGQISAPNQLLTSSEPASNQFRTSYRNGVWLLVIILCYRTYANSSDEGRNWSMSAEVTTNEKSGQEPPQTDGSVVFARCRQYAFPCGNIGCTWRIWLNLCFLRPTRVHNPNSKPTGSAVSAQLTANVPILYNGRPFPQNCPFSWGSGPHLIRDSLGSFGDHNPNGMMIDSVVFAHVTVECPYTLLRAPPSRKLLLSMGRSEPHLTQKFLGTIWAHNPNSISIAVLPFWHIFAPAISSFNRSTREAKDCLETYMTTCDLRVFPVWPRTVASCRENQFECYTGRCIRSSLVCDGHNDCGHGDFSDEQNCSEWLFTDAYLTYLYFYLFYYFTVLHVSDCTVTIPQNSILGLRTSMRKTNEIYSHTLLQQSVNGWRSCWDMSKISKKYRITSKNS